MSADRMLPDVLQSLNGERISSSESWRLKRRPELLELFREYVYGRESVERPASLSLHTIDSREAMEGRAIRKQAELRYEGPGGRGVLRVLLYVPTGLLRPCPAFLLLNHRESDLGAQAESASSPFWPAERIVSRGYAAALVNLAEADPDFDDGYRNGVHGIFDSPVGERPPNAWGTIAAWAWAASRAMDYLQTVPELDPARIAVVGHSRGGKAALWAGATDERFSLVIGNGSGCTGAALARGNRGETIRDINERFPHWFCGNYKSFNGREYELPVDQHMLLSLIAPRAVYVASASEDDWADPRSEFASLVHASPAFRLFGFSGLEGEPFPSVGTSLARERMGYHLRSGVHALTEEDWDRFMDFADRT